jgi:hypothetical protein
LGSFVYYRRTYFIGLEATHMFGLGSGLFGLGFLSLIQLALLAGLVLIAWRGRSRYVVGTSIVLTAFRLDKNPLAEMPVEIVGRLSGILSWFLTLLRIQPEVHLVVTRTAVSITRTSLGGLSHIYIPLEKISATVCGYQRSMVAFALAAYFSAQFLLILLTGLFLGLGQTTAGNSTAVFAGSAIAAVGYLFLAVITGIIFVLSKRIGISIETMHPHGVAFKRSIVGNAFVDLPEAMQAIGLINGRVLAAQTATAVAAGSPPFHGA